MKAYDIVSEDAAGMMGDENKTNRRRLLMQEVLMEKVYFELLKAKELKKKKREKRQARRWMIATITNSCLYLVHSHCTASSLFMLKSLSNSQNRQEKNGSDLPLEKGY